MTIYSKDSPQVKALEHIIREHGKKGQLLLDSFIEEIEIVDNHNCIIIATTTEYLESVISELKDILDIDAAAIMIANNKEDDSKKAIMIDEQEIVLKLSRMLEGPIQVGSPPLVSHLVNGTDTFAMVQSLVAVDKAQPIIIPKIIHFIWAGGRKPMPNKDLSIIDAWAKQNPLWEIYFWIDGRDKEYTNILERHYIGKLEIIKDKLKIKLIQELTQKFKDLLDCAYYEIDKEYPNFGASSDILRYLVLYEYGGAYFDTDVSPGRNTLDDLAQDKPAILYVEHLTQEPNPSLGELVNFSLEHIGNDTFVSTKNNPLILSIINSIRTSYCCQQQTPCIDDQVMRVFAAENIRDITIKTTGPVGVRKVIQVYKPIFSENLHEWLVDDVVLRRVRSEKLAIVAPQRNTLNWLLHAVQNKFFTPESAIKAITDNASFEIQHFKIFRFEDYVDIMLNALQTERGTEEAKKTLAIQKVYEILNELLARIQHIQFIQITGKYDPPKELLKQLQLYDCQTIFTLKDVSWFDLAFRYSTFMDRLHSELDKIESMSKTSGKNAQEIVNISVHVKTLHC